MSDHLVEIDQKEWPKLRDLYKAKGSNRYVAYMTISNYIRWFEQDPNLKHIKFYSLNGDFSDGSFIVIVSGLLYLLNVKILMIFHFSIDILYLRIRLVIHLMHCFDCCF